MKESEIRAHEVAQKVPAQYQQPTNEYTGRVVQNNKEMVTYSSSSHIRIWYNNQEDGYPLHTHDAWEVVICVENHYKVHINNTNYDLQEGDILIIPPRTPHEFFDSQYGVRFIYLIEMNSFYLSHDYKIIEPLFFNGYLCNRETAPTIYETVYKHFMDMNTAYFNSSLFWETIIYEKMYRIFISVAKQLNQAVGTNSNVVSMSTSRINALLRYIDVNYVEDITTEQAADYCGFSKYHFLRTFKAHTGYTFHDYLNIKKIQMAEEFLSTDMSITTIAFQTGFNSLPSFCRTFKKYTNYSPSEYKKLRTSEEMRNHKFSVLNTTESNTSDDVL